MKKLFLSLLCTTTALAGFAQTARTHSSTAVITSESAESLFGETGAAKTAGLSDTLYFASTAQLNGPFTNYVNDVAAPFDSGRYYGINNENYKAFAQLYRFRAIDASGNNDTTLQVLGLVSRWGGRAGASSTRVINLGIWRRDSTGANKKVAVPGRTKFYMSALPQATPVATRSVPITSLVLTNASGFAGNTITYFTSPINNVAYDMYAGYSVSYTWGSTGGDTVGLASTGSSTPSSNTFVIETGTLDTLVTSFTISQNSSNAWQSSLTRGFNGGNLICYPIIKLDCPLCNDPASVPGVERNGLTVFGSYPNPAVNTANIRFALAAGADITLTVMDAAGRTVGSQKHAAMSAGEHVLPVSTATLAAGNYVYLLETNKGDGVAVQFSVAK